MKKGVATTENTRIHHSLHKKQRTLCTVQLNNEGLRARLEHLARRREGEGYLLPLQLPAEQDML